MRSSPSLTDLHVCPTNQLETRASSRVDASQLSDVAAPSFVPSACLRLSCEELKPHVHASPHKLRTPISTVFPLQPKPPILLRSSCQHRRPWSTPQQLLQRQPSIVDSSRGLISTKQRLELLPIPTDVHRQLARSQSQAQPSAQRNWSNEAQQASVFSKPK